LSGTATLLNQITTKPIVNRSPLSQRRAVQHVIVQFTGLPPELRDNLVRPLQQLK